jgi:hypothetical protein
MGLKKMIPTDDAAHGTDTHGGQHPDAAALHITALNQRGWASSPLADLTCALAHADTRSTALKKAVQPFPAARFPGISPPASQAWLVPAMVPLGPSRELAGRLGADQRDLRSLGYFDQFLRRTDNMVGHRPNQPSHTLMPPTDRDASDACLLRRADIT